MKVRVMIGAQAAYACITTESVSMDVKLEAGRSAQQSLREYAEEQAQKALRLMRWSQLAKEAAEILEKKDEVAA